MESVFYDHLRAGDEAADDTDVAAAYDIYRSSWHHVLDSVIMTKADDEKIVEALGLSKAALAIYRHLFFDRGVFAHAFAVRTYVRGLRSDNSEEFKCYTTAMIEGPEAVLNTYRIGDMPYADPLDVARRAMTELSSRVREHRQNAITTRTAQEALRAGKAAVDVAATLHSMAPKSGARASELLEIELRAKELTVTAEFVGVRIVDLVREGPGPGVDGDNDPAVKA